MPALRAALAARHQVGPCDLPELMLVRLVHICLVVARPVDEHGCTLLGEAGSMATPKRLVSCVGRGQVGSAIERHAASLLVTGPWLDSIGWMQKRTLNLILVDGPP